MIEAEDLSVRFRDANGGEILALQSVSVRFEAGRFYTVIGPSGSGKTTLMQVIAGILRPSSGRISAAGVALDGLSEGKRDAWRRKHCGMIFQDFRLIEELSPLSNVLVPAWFDHLTTPGELRMRAEKLLDHFNVPSRTGAVAMLSRGQQQRVAMARALLLDADIILADEPTASVDKANAVLIIDELERLAHGGKTVICVSHDDRVAARADQVFEIEDGRIVGSAARPAAAEQLQ